MNGADYDAPSAGERWTALLLTSACFVVIYNLANYFAAVHAAGTAAFEWERNIPFVAWMIYPYWSVDLFFIAAPFVIASRGALAAHTRRICAAIVIAGICFILFPLRLEFQRPEVGGFAGVLFNLLDSFDRPHNLVPSLHIALRSILWCTFVAPRRGLLKAGLAFWFFLIGLSTLLTWQHQVIDVFTGQLLGLLVIHLIPERTLPAPGTDLEQRVNSNGSIALRYLGAAILCAAIGVLTGLAGIVMLWPAAALAIVACAYLGSGPGLFRKTNGKIPPGSRVLLAPYLAGTELSYCIYTKNEPSHVQVRPGLLMGRKWGEDEGAAAAEIAAVLDLTAEYNEHPALLGKRYRNVPILDLTLPSAEQIRECIEFIRDNTTLGPTLVHCSLGRSRAPLVVAAYLVAEELAASIDAALDEIRRVKPNIVIHNESARIIADYCKREER